MYFLVLYNETGSGGGSEASGNNNNLARAIGIFYYPEIKVPISFLDVYNLISGRGIAKHL